MKQDLTRPPVSGQIRCPVQQSRSDAMAPVTGQNSQPLQVTSVCFHEQTAGTGWLILYPGHQMQCPAVLCVEFLREALFLQKHLFPDGPGFVRQKTVFANL